MNIPVFHGQFGGAIHSPFWADVHEHRDSSLGSIEQRWFTTVCPPPRILVNAAKKFKEDGWWWEGKAAAAQELWKADGPPDIETLLTDHF